jgi:hypothetical protein
MNQAQVTAALAADDNPSVLGQDSYNEAYNPVTTVVSMTPAPGTCVFSLFGFQVTWSNDYPSCLPNRVLVPTTGEPDTVPIYGLTYLDPALGGDYVNNPCVYAGAANDTLEEAPPA